jgi:tartrate dehydrogenase/decarboxylase/D-malate dehydrogenase
VAVIAGDGIGREVIPAGMAALEAVTRGSDVSLSFTDFPWGCEFYLKHQRMLDEDAFEQLAKFDAIYLGAIGAPTVPDHISAGDMILPLRKVFEQYVNLRPMRLLPGLSSPLANRGPADIDMVCVRENSEGEYSGLGGRIHVGTPYEAAEQTGLFTRHGIERILRYGFEVAAKRPRKMLASATKSNALRHAMVLWDEVADQVSKDYPNVEYRKYHVDAIAARMVTNPASLDVIVCSNLFGDILTDIGSAISGSLGIAPGAIPRLPESAEPTSVRMSPNMLDATITSSVPGCVIIRAASASTWYLRYVTSGYSVATASIVSSQSTMECWSALDFVALANDPRGLRCARAKA